MKFSVVAAYFEQIEEIASRNAMVEKLAELFHVSSSTEIGIICNLALGRLDPPYIGTTFNIAEKSLVKAVALFTKQSEQEVGLQLKKIGDIGALFELWPVVHEESSYDVIHTYSLLKEIALFSGVGSQEKKVAQLVYLFSCLDVKGRKFAARIIVGKLRLGFSDMTLIDALSWMQVGTKALKKPIENAYNLCVDIGYIAEALKQGGIEAVKTIELTVGIPVRPAAAERINNPEDIVKKIGPCIAQPKLDGFRVQIHIDTAGEKHRIFFFSRNLQNMSYMFPDLASECLSVAGITCIMEGEAIAYDEDEGAFLPFQETVKRKRKHGIEKMKEEIPLQLFLFDILYLNGESLLVLPHEERRKQLTSVYALLVQKSTQKSIKLIEEVTIATAQDLELYFNENISMGLEGVVVKRPDASYQPGKRNFNWIKLKRQQYGHLADTIDAVILGYYKGSGKRASFGIGAFLVGVYDEKRDLFETIAKVGTGLKDQEWKELKKLCDEHEIDKKLYNVSCDKNLFPDVWIEPSIVVALSADEITISPSHTAGKKNGDTTGYALRFPRFESYRTDKS
ncbi:MAG: ATP-dependent DNA ligase, partial [Candidatus Babeliales bacterium]